MDEDVAQLERIAREVRAFLEPHWAEWHRKTGSLKGLRSLSQGTCGRSSRFLVEVLREAGFDARPAFGCPIGCDCGFCAPEGTRGHIWVVVRDPPRIVDVTADQFGDAPVIVTGMDDPRYQEGHDRAGPEWIEDRERVTRRLLPLWRARVEKKAPDGAMRQTGERA
ncbi:MAG: Transglutaminase-like superfamily [Rhodobacteraceae bacterium HLUCCO07]|nr:MAG: Transglutaminase-like superfamily [Rhodobacteraceae bacterium HLUCCO07]